MKNTWIGPLAVAVDATYWSDYEGGIFDGCSYNDSISLNHAVQVNISYHYMSIMAINMINLMTLAEEKQLIQILFSSSDMERAQHTEIIG